MNRTQERVNKITKVAQKRTTGVVVLEDIVDPHNAAAVFRSCDAFGIQNVYLVFDKQDSFDPKKIGRLSSSSANKWLDFHIFNNIIDCYHELHNQGFVTIATVLNKNSSSVYDIDFTKNKNIALVFGNEHGGLSSDAIKGADQTMYIPMNGMVQSLNISVTAGICLFEMSRQRNESNDLFYLSEANQEILKNSLLER